MSWHDPARSSETAEDRALRDELRQLLGGPEPHAEAATTPSTITLAEDLRREALRRRHTPNVVPLRHKPTFALLAAALPLALVVGGLGFWGMQQKRKAEQLAAAIREKDAERKRLEQEHEAALQRQREAMAPERLQQASTTPRTSRDARQPREVVRPTDRPIVPQPVDLQRVKDPK